MIGWPGLVYSTRTYDARTSCDRQCTTGHCPEGDSLTRQTAPAVQSATRDTPATGVQHTTRQTWPTASAAHPTRNPTRPDPHGRYGFALGVLARRSSGVGPSQHTVQVESLRCVHACVRACVRATPAHALGVRITETRCGIRRAHRIRRARSSPPATAGAGGLLCSGSCLALRCAHPTHHSHKRTADWLRATHHARPPYAAQHARQQRVAHDCERSACGEPQAGLSRARGAAAEADDAAVPLRARVCAALPLHEHPGTPPYPRTPTVRYTGRTRTLPAPVPPQSLSDAPQAPASACERACMR